MRPHQSLTCLTKLSFKAGRAVAGIFQAVVAINSASGSIITLVVDAAIDT